MDKKEHEEILYRLDERTKRVDEHLNRLDERVAENSEKLANHDDRIQSNTADVKTGKGLLAFIAAAISGIVAKLAGMLHL